MLGKQCTVAATLLHSRWPVQAMNIMTKASELALFYLAVSTESKVLESACSKSSNAKVPRQVSVERSVLVFSSSHYTG